ncbi:hypothetical protein HK097_010380 [Rhizophlyctis rosea]|uniref:Uncharacterized protein n=1 Tax=Rhizophlyctis rosea TaxID=64517 RepID=A0AAD5X2K7_9FUNG|nr:hypothetical protein HK097_010380 [Rhizophlyctis rosea]
MRLRTFKNLHSAVSRAVHAHIRFTLNLLLLLTAGPTLRRVISILAGTKEGVTMKTLAFEHLAKLHPTVSFIQEFPGAVKSMMERDAKGILKFFFGAFSGTSGRFPPKEGHAKGTLTKNVEVAKGTDGVVGTGVYAVDRGGEVAGEGVQKLLERYRKDGPAEKVSFH